MNNIQILNYNERSIRQMVSEDGEILFCARDVANALGCRDAHNITRILDEDDPPYPVSTLTKGGIQKLSFVNEYQLYAILTALRTERTKPFRRWVTHEVLPSIRRNGYYSINKPLMLSGNIPEVFMKLAKEYEALYNKVEELKPLADARNRTLKLREKYDSRPEREYDVHVRYKDGSYSWIRTLPRDIAIFLKSLKNPREAGKILEEANSHDYHSNDYIRSIVMPRYKKKLYISKKKSRQ